MKVNNIIKETLLTSSKPENYSQFTSQMIKLKINEITDVLYKYYGEAALNKRKKGYKFSTN